MTKNVDDKKIRICLVLASVTFSGFLFFLVYRYKFDLENIQSLVSIFGSLSIVIAVLGFFHQKEQSRVGYTTDQISFFRKEITPILKKIREEFKKNQKVPSNKCNIDVKNPTIEYIRDNYQEKVKIQLEETKINEDVYFLKVDLLDALEEFSRRVINSESIENEALECVRPAFIYLVENNAVLLVQHREVTSGNSVYSGILEVYNAWELKVDKTDPEERAKKFIKP